MTDEQRSLAWSPRPPFEPTGGTDCRFGGSVGIDWESRRTLWTLARYWYRKEQQ